MLIANQSWARHDNGFSCNVLPIVSHLISFLQNGHKSTRPSNFRSRNVSHKFEWIPTVTNAIKTMHNTNWQKKTEYCHIFHILYILLNNSNFHPKSLQLIDRQFFFIFLYSHICVQCTQNRRHDEKLDSIEWMFTRIPTSDDHFNIEHVRNNNNRNEKKTIQL